MSITDICFFISLKFVQKQHVFAFLQTLIDFTILTYFAVLHRNLCVVILFFLVAGNIAENADNTIIHTARYHLVAL